MASTIQVDTIKDIGGNTMISSNGSGTFTNSLPAPTSGIAASAIDSGTIATARLGSGTASSSTFLRGDQTYAAAGGGKVLQVLQTAGAFITTIASTTYTLNMSAPSITPSSTSSKILIMHSAPSGITLSNTSNMGHVTLYRDAVNITTFGHGSSFASYQGASPLSGTNIIYLDSPSSTSAIVYSVYVKTDNASLSMVYGYSAGQPRGSSITVMEIGV